MDLILSVPPFLYRIPVSHGIEAGKEDQGKGKQYGVCSRMGGALRGRYSLAVHLEVTTDEELARHIG